MMAPILARRTVPVNRPAVVGDCSVGPIQVEPQRILPARLDRSWLTWTVFWEIDYAKKEKRRCAADGRCMARSSGTVGLSNRSV